MEISKQPESEQHLSQQKSNRAWSSAVQLPTVGLGGGVSDKEPEPAAAWTPKHPPLTLELAPGACYL